MSSCSSIFRHSHPGGISNGDSGGRSPLVKIIDHYETLVLALLCFSKGIDVASEVFCIAVINYELLLRSH